MKVLIGVDPHKASLAVAAVDEATGDLLERASFAQDRVGLRGLERWAKQFPERRWAMENARGLGRHLAGRLAATGEAVVDVPPKLSAKVRVLSTGNARKNDGLDALATALAASRNERLAAVGDDDFVPLEHTIELYRAIPNSELAVVPGTSHVHFMEKPSLVNRIVLDFLDNDPVPTMMPLRRAAAPGSD